MELPGEITEQLSSFKGTLDALEDYLTPFTDVTPKEMDAQLPPLERARAHLALAQASCLLFQMHLKLHGQRPEDHPIKQEMERLEKYDKKVRKALAAEELASTRPAVTLDIAAANRFIDHAIPDLSKEQKERLKQAGAAMKKRAGPATAETQHQAKKKKQKSASMSVDEESALLLEQAFATEEPELAAAPAVAGQTGVQQQQAGTSGQEQPAPTAAQPAKKKKRKSVQATEAAAVSVHLDISGGAEGSGHGTATDRDAEAGVELAQAAGGTAALGGQELTERPGAPLQVGKHKKKRKSIGS